MKNPIEAAVAPLKADALDRAAKNAREQVAKYEALLAEREGKRLPYPKSYGMGRNEWFAAKAKYDVLNSLTAQGPVQARQAMGEVQLYVMDATKVEWFVQDAMDNAGAQYDGFVAKLVGKVGEVAKAELAGNHVWGYSVLTVTKADGSVEKWKTQQIVNVSKLGLLFNQWPSRKVK